MTVTDKSGQEKTTEWFLNKISDFTLELEETIKATRAITENDQPVTLALSTQKYSWISIIVRIN